MLLVARQQILAGLRDIKFIFLAAIVVLAFLTNAVVYSELYFQGIEDYSEASARVTAELHQVEGNLQEVSNHPQKVVRPPNPLAFIADGGQQSIPNTWSVNAFRVTDPAPMTRGNEMLPTLPALDWAFIVGALISLLAVLIAYDAISGEKRSGTLRQVLANQLSRSKLFLGKYVGLLMVLLLVFAAGAALNVTIMVSRGVIALSGETLFYLAWAVVLSVACFSFALLTSLCVSALTRNPVVSLVILVIGWILVVVAVPGFARVAAELTVSVRSDYETAQAFDAAEQALRDSMPENTFYWDGSLEGEHVRLRCTYCQRRVQNLQRLVNESVSQRIEQAANINVFSSISPAGLLGSGLQQLCNSGVYGFELTYETAQRYQRQLHDFTVEADRRDTDSPHYVCSYGEWTFGGMFSTEPVEIASLPRFSSLWRTGGVPRQQQWPWLQLLLFLAGNLQMGLTAVIAISRYDPR